MNYKTTRTSRQYVLLLFLGKGVDRYHFFSLKLKVIANVYLSNLIYLLENQFLFGFLLFCNCLLATSNFRRLKSTKTVKQILFISSIVFYFCSLLIGCSKPSKTNPTILYQCKLIGNRNNITNSSCKEISFPFKSSLPKEVEVSTDKNMSITVTFVEEVEKWFIISLFDIKFQSIKC